MVGEDDCVRNVPLLLDWDAITSVDETPVFIAIVYVFQGHSVLSDVVEATELVKDAATIGRESDRSANLWCYRVTTFQQDVVYAGSFESIRKCQSCDATTTDDHTKWS